MIQWVIENELARSPRPGYPFGQPRLSDLKAWLKEVKDMQIRSILCLLEERELAYYEHLKLHAGGLLGWYEENGFSVVHVPVEDRAGPPLSQEDFEQVWSAFQRVDKPVLFHCNAGIDRTGAAVRFLVEHLGKENR